MNCFVRGTMRDDMIFSINNINMTIIDNIKIYAMIFIIIQDSQKQKIGEFDIEKKVYCNFYSLCLNFKIQILFIIVMALKLKKQTSEI